MKRFKEYLQEKTFNINKDIDYIYNKFFKQRIKSMQKGTYNYPKGDFTFGTMYSKDLPSKTAQKANEVKPIIIEAGILDIGNGYAPLRNKMYVSINTNAINVFHKFNLKTIEDVKNVLKPDSYKQWTHEFTESVIKGSISHELSHWMNDAIYNLNLSKTILKVRSAPNIYTGQKIFNMGELDVNMTFKEIDAQVHAMKQLKKDYKKDWDILTIHDISNIKPSFSGVFKDIKKKGKQVYDTYMKRFLHRLDREKLLGKNMKYIPYEKF